LEIQGGYYPSSSSTLSFLIGGGSNPTGYGQLAISGQMTLSGSLGISLTNGFAPSVGDTFRIITWDSRKGGFSAASGFDLSNGLYFQGIADASGLSLVTKSTVVPKPPPPTNLVNQVVAFGDTAVFSFSPLGVEPFSYQWTFYGTNIPAQTNAN